MPRTEVTAILPRSAIEQAEAVSRADEQPVVGLTAGNLARLARPIAGRRGSDQPILAIGRAGRRRV